MEMAYKIKREVPAKDIRVTEETRTSMNYGLEEVLVVELKMVEDGLREMAHMDFVIRGGGRAGVSGSGGDFDDKVFGMAELVRQFVREHKPKSLVNQVHDREELTAMYRAGLRAHDFTGKLIEQDEAWELMKQYTHRSIMVRWDAPVDISE